ncbi:hypothetical protein K490DRAFT_48111 [Saccharata proteae CBS 121410]|uniref:NAD dependent epimerase/dehydratase n=1 Tax=Saccharata proteae CBS 121410 TaxID=1314787 RepID=A0A9P4HR44_9PEZI|nr:hypothetical protein K490DRAFT_48111 [Saccharata proteae CBS 121410]
MVVPSGERGSRLIDQDTSVRTRPMKVLCLGMPRTGTSSLRDALAMLGYQPHHFREMMLEWEREIPLWSEALEAKYYGKCKPYGREEFDKLLGEYDCVEDNPSVLFAEDLIKAYPEAKVILTNRDVDKWAVSMKNTIFKTRDSIHNDPDTVKAVFNNHYKKIREMTPKDQLLELHFGDGWEPLCKFLGVPVPDTPWPHSNDSSVFQNRHIYAQRWLVLLLIGLATMGFVAWYTWGEASMLYADDPFTFKRYLKLSKFLFHLLNLWLE